MSDQTPASATMSKTQLVFAAFVLAVCLSARAETPAGTTIQTAVFAGGCFWGVDAVFKHVKGVAEVESGYTGGKATTAQYEKVSNGTTGHAEAVRVKFNPAQVSYQQLLQVFFGVAHDPTQLNRQGPDVGSQYRSAVFYSDSAQQKMAESYIQKLTNSRAFPKPVVTQVTPLHEFYPAEKIPPELSGLAS